MADEYDSLYGARPETKPEDELVLDYVSSRLPDGASVLDVGCGTGYFLDNLYWPRGLYLGFDYSARMLLHAMEKHPGYVFSAADARNGGWPPWQGGGPRWIVALFSVYLWADPYEFVSMYRRYGAEGAVVVTATPLHETGASIEGYRFETMPWTVDAILDAAGDRVIDITPFAYGGEIVDESQAHYLCVELQ
jgi:SAM-dependent methyltransferase